MQMLSKLIVIVLLIFTILGFNIPTVDNIILADQTDVSDPHNIVLTEII